MSKTREKIQQWFSFKTKDEVGGALVPATAPAAATSQRKKALTSGNLLVLAIFKVLTSPIFHFMAIPLAVALIGLIPFKVGYTPSNIFACGVTTNNWCIDTTTGWTKFTASQGSGTCGTSAGTYTGTCIIAVDNSTAASFTGHMSGTTTLVIDSGTPPTVGQTVVRADGTRLGTITGGSNPNFTISTSATFVTEALTSSNGNDTTCRSQTPPSNPFTSDNWATFTPTLPCFTQLTAAGLFRNATYTVTATGLTASISGTTMTVSAVGAGTIMVGSVMTGGSAVTDTTVVSQISGTTGGVGTYAMNISQTSSPTTATLSVNNATSDWFLTKKGTTFTGYILGGNSPVNGKSSVEPLVIGTYGTGERPKFTSTASASECFRAQAARGRQMAIIGYWCQGALLDPNSSSFLGATLTADAGTTICGAANLICNTTVPAFVQSGAANANRAYGTGIVNTNISSATATTITLASNVSNDTTVGTGQMQIQVLTNTAGTGFNWLVFDLLILEDNRCDYCGFSIQDSSNVASHIPNVRARRNMLARLYYPPNGGDNIYTGYTPLSGSLMFEENAMTFGGWEPQIWGGSASGFLHSLYLHNPSAPINLYSNVVAYNPADNQYRDSGTAYNNLFLFNAGGGALSQQIQNNPGVNNYNVIQNQWGIPVATRTATAADGIGGSILHTPGMIAGNPNILGTKIANLTNPNSIGDASNNCTVSSIRDAVSVNVSCTLTAGIRGDGVQIGDVIRFFGTGFTGVFTHSGGQYPDGLAVYPAYTSVSMTAASPAVITDTANRTHANGEPFSFTPVIIRSAGTGYGTSATGTLTWSGTGCSVNPVINVSTNASGNIVAYNSITTAGTCSTPPSATDTSHWLAGGGLSAGSGVSLYYNMSMGTLPTGVSLATDTGGCTGTLVTNTNSGKQICTYYALANGTSYQFSATSGGTPINTSGSAGSNLTRTGASQFYFTSSVPTLYPSTIPSAVSVGTAAYPYESGVLYMGGPNGKTTVQTIAADRISVVFNDGIITDFPTDATILFGLPTPCVVYPSCYTLRFGPNNILAHPEYMTANGVGSYAIEFGLLTSGYDGSGNYIFNWNSTTSQNTVDLGFSGANSLVGTQVLNTWNETRFPKANIEYYDASQLETSNTFQGYISGNTLTITSASPPTLEVPTVANGGTGDTIFDTTASANVVAQYTRVTAQISSTQYYVSVSQTAGSLGTPITMMYGSSNRFLSKALNQKKETGWNSAYTAGAANDYIRTQLQCGNQSTFPSSPACPPQGNTVH